MVFLARIVVQICSTLRAVRLVNLVDGVSVGEIKNVIIANLNTERLRNMENI